MSNLIANILLVNDEDRVYSKLRGHEHYDPKDDISIIKPFDTEEYLKTHQINPIKLRDRIIETTRELYKISQEKIKFFTEEKAKGTIIKKEFNNTVYEDFKEYLKGAQKSIELYLLIGNPSLSGVKDDPGIADLVSMLKDPIKMFGNLKTLKPNQKMIDTMDDLKNQDQVLANFKKDAAKIYNNEIKPFIENERQAESNFNKQANTLWQEILELQKIIKILQEK